MKPTPRLRGIFAFGFVFPACSAIAGEILVQREILPDQWTYEVETYLPRKSGFFSYHAPPGRYTQQQIDQALVGLTPFQTATLQSSKKRLVVDERVASTRTTVDLNGNLQGVDFSGDSLDHETWAGLTPSDVEVRVSTETTRLREIGEYTYEEVVIKPPPGNESGIGSTVHITTWSEAKPTDLVSASDLVLRYSPATVPGFIPAALVQNALTGSSAGQQVPLATGYGLLDLGRAYGDYSETMEAYNVEFGVDYIGDPEDYFTWIAISEKSIQVNVFLVEEHGRSYLDQTLEYVLVVPDSTGQVFQNPKQVVTATVRDTTNTWDKHYFKSGNIPPQIDSADVTTLLSKLNPGQSGMALHQRVETPEEQPSITTVEAIDAHGAQQGIDYSGNPANPATWTALTANDVIADRIETRTTTTEATGAHQIYQLYVESGGTTGELKIIHNNCVGRDIVRVNRGHLNRMLDLQQLPVGISAYDIEKALAWAKPGETVIVSQTTESTLASTINEPLPDYSDTNQWQLGTDFTGDPGDMQTWVAAGPHDVYIDLYHPVKRTRTYDELVINHLVTAPANHQPGPRHAGISLVTLAGDPNPALDVLWKSPVGMEFGVETSSDLIHFAPVDTLIKSTGQPSSYLHLHPPSQAPELKKFLRVKRR